MENTLNVTPFRQAAWQRVVSLAVVVAGTLIACTTPPEQRSTWDRVRSTGIMRVGYAVEAPFAMVDSAGRVTGESPELLRLVMRELGVDSIEWVATAFGSLIPELQRGDFDVIAAGMYITPEREKTVLFTMPTLRDPTALLMRASDSARITSLNDFARDSTRTLAVIAGAAEEPLAVAAGLRLSQLRAVPDPATGRAAVLSGEADAFALSTVSLTRLLRTQGDSARLAVRAMSFPDNPTLQNMALGRPAYAMRLDDHQLRDAMNGALDRLLGTPAHRTVQQRFGL